MQHRFQHPELPHGGTEVDQIAILKPNGSFDSEAISPLWELYVPALRVSETLLNSQNII